MSDTNLSPIPENVTPSPLSNSGADKNQSGLIKVGNRKISTSTSETHLATFFNSLNLSDNDNDFDAYQFDEDWNGPPADNSNENQDTLYLDKNPSEKQLAKVIAQIDAESQHQQPTIAQITEQNLDHCRRFLNASINDEPQQQSDKDNNKNLVNSRKPRNVLDAQIESVQQQTVANKEVVSKIQTSRSLSEHNVQAHNPNSDDSTFFSGIRSFVAKHRKSVYASVGGISGGAVGVGIAALCLLIPGVNVAAAILYASIGGGCAVFGAGYGLYRASKAIKAQFQAAQATTQRTKSPKTSNQEDSFQHIDPTEQLAYMNDILANLHQLNPSRSPSLQYNPSKGYSHGTNTANEKAVTEEQGEKQNKGSTVSNLQQTPQQVLYNTNGNAGRAEGQQFEAPNLNLNKVDEVDDGLSDTESIYELDTGSEGQHVRRKTVDITVVNKDSTAADTENVAAEQDKIISSADIKSAVEETNKLKSNDQQPKSKLSNTAVQSARQRPVGRMPSNAQPAYMRKNHRLTRPDKIRLKDKKCGAAIKVRVEELINANAKKATNGKTSEAMNQEFTRAEITVNNQKCATQELFEANLGDSAGVVSSVLHGQMFNAVTTVLRESKTTKQNPIPYNFVVQNPIEQFEQLGGRTVVSNQHNTLSYTVNKTTASDTLYAFEAVCSVPIDYVEHLEFGSQGDAGAQMSHWPTDSSKSYYKVKLTGTIDASRKDNPVELAENNPIITLIARFKEDNTTSGKSVNKR